MQLLFCWDSRVDFTYSSATSTVSKAKEDDSSVINELLHSLRSWRDFARECFCFSSEALDASAEAVKISLAASPVASSLEGIWRLRRRSPAHESRQLRRLITPLDVSIGNHFHQRSTAQPTVREKMQGDCTLNHNTLRAKLSPQAKKIWFSCSRSYTNSIALVEFE